MKKIFYSVIFLTTALILNSCYYFDGCDETNCGSMYSQIQLNFNLDSLNGGYTMAELSKVKITGGPGGSTSPSSNGTYNINTGWLTHYRYETINIHDETTEKKNVLSNFMYYQINTECDCKADNVIRTFNYNGVKVTLPEPNWGNPYKIYINK